MNQRHETARRYLETLERVLQQGWGNAVQKPELDNLEKLALLHPEHLNSIDLPSHKNVAQLREQIQGKRGFGSQFLRTKCESELIWGYKCPLNADIQQDHLFPYSLGGPTIGTNRILLCKYNNMVKTSDIHCFPWEEFTIRCEPWLDFQIKRMREEVFDIYS